MLTSLTAYTARGGRRAAIFFSGCHQFLRSAQRGLVAPQLLLRLMYGASSPYLDAALTVQLLVIAVAMEYVGEMIGKTLLGVGAGRLASLVIALGLAMAVLTLPLIMMVRRRRRGACARHHQPYSPGHRLGGAEMADLEGRYGPRTCTNLRRRHDRNISSPIPTWTSVRCLTLGFGGGGDVLKHDVRRGQCTLPFRCD